jgi:hypothetical protein
MHWLIASMLMLGGHTGLNSTHAKSCRLNLYGADMQHSPVAYYTRLQNRCRNFAPSRLLILVLPL